MGFFDKVKQGLTKTRNSMSAALNAAIADFTGENEEVFDDLEEMLILSDAGAETAEEIIRRLRDRVWVQGSRGEKQLKDALTDILTEYMDVGDTVLHLDTKPSVILVVGVNGVGKTTTIGKLASLLAAEGKSVLLCAGDTFRAAAAEQLTIWAERAEADIVAQHEGADPSSVLYDGIAAANARNADIVLCDTAGRLHNKKNLMQELEKMHRVVMKAGDDYLVRSLIVLDATTGQNALNQARAFKEVTDVDGIILTKLDGTAKGGVVLSVQMELQLPVLYAGTGEKLQDLEKFDAHAFVEKMFEDED
jgi:fused signal recognition particle receptor